MNIVYINIETNFRPPKVLWYIEGFNKKVYNSEKCLIKTITNRSFSIHLITSALERVHHGVFYRWPPSSM
eukprot:UN01543